jgi:Flp pilus assembly protein TadG
MTGAPTSRPPAGVVDHASDRGSLSIVLALLVTVVLGGGALVVDGGRAMAARRHAANTAEAAARTAVARTSLTNGFDPARAAELAIDHAVRSGVDPADVQVTVRTGPTGEPEVVVTITERRTAVFVALTGADQLTVRATGAATFLYDT